MRQLLALFVLFPLMAAAETAYVTDNLRLEMTDAPNNGGQRVQMLESGQEMEVFARGQGYANVRLPDNTEGWVKSAYLVTEKPAKLIVAETIEQRDVLQGELTELRASFAAPAETIAGLESQTATLSSDLVEANSRIADLEQQAGTVESVRQQYKGSLPLKWVAGALFVCLIAGFLLGLWWIDRRIRSRHGGFRVY